MDFDWKIFDSTLVIIVLFLLLTDLFLIVGVRKAHKYICFLSLSPCRYKAYFVDPAWS